SADRELARRGPLQKKVAGFGHQGVARAGLVDREVAEGRDANAHGHRQGAGQGAAGGGQGVAGAGLVEGQVAEGGEAVDRGHAGGAAQAAAAGVAAQRQADRGAGADRVVAGVQQLDGDGRAYGLGGGGGGRLLQE